MYTKDLINKRGTFADIYGFSRSELHWRHKWPRLLDCLLVVANGDDAEYFDPCAVDEFSVVDMHTAQKAWFEIPQGATPEVITGLVESHFASTARRITESTWAV